MSSWEHIWNLDENKVETHINEQSKPSDLTGIRGWVDCVNKGEINAFVRKDNSDGVRYSIKRYPWNKYSKETIIYFLQDTKRGCAVLGFDKEFRVVVFLREDKISEFEEMLSQHSE